MIRSWIAYFQMISAAAFLMIAALPLPAFDVQELERGALKYRSEHVQQGFVRLHVTNELGPEQGEFLFDIDFDNNRRRQRLRSRGIGQFNWNMGRTVILTSEHYMSAEAGSIPAEAGNLSTFRNYREFFAVLNPIILGMDIGGASGLHTNSMEDLLNRSDREAVHLSTESHGDILAYRIDYQIKGSVTQISLWIAPDQGFAIVKSRLRDEKRQRFRTIENVMKRFPTEDAWYPASVVMTDWKGDQPIKRQVTQVEEARFGQPVDDAIFSLAGLELKPGRQVIDSTTGQPWSHIWDGKEAVLNYAIPQTGPEDARMVPINRRLLLAISLLSGAVAIVCLWRVLSRRGRKTAILSSQNR